MQAVWHAANSVLCLCLAGAAGSASCACAHCQCVPAGLSLQPSKQLASLLEPICRAAQLLETSCWMLVQGLETIELEELGCDEVLAGRTLHCTTRSCLSLAAGPGGG